VVLTSRLAATDHHSGPTAWRRACAGAIDFRLGKRIWQQLFNDRSKWGVLRERVQARCPAVVEAGRTTP